MERQHVQTRLRIGTRGSALALAQTNMVIAALGRAHDWSAEEAAARAQVVPIKTTGDKVQDRPLADIGGKSLFAKELEEALIAGTIDCAVHSLKDLPGLLPPGLIIACHLQREDPRDALVAKVAKNLHELQTGAVVGTSSVRRKAMLLNARPDLSIVNFRGNVDTRLRKLAAGDADATVLALAGLKRLGAESHANHIFSAEEMLPAVAQGAIGVEVLETNTRLRDLLSPADHREAALAVTLERAFLATLDGSCRTPIAGLAEWRDRRTLMLRGCVLSPDGRTRFDVTRVAAATTAAEALDAGTDAGRELISKAGRHFFEV
jgi:hydroxymethylbilane synthase